jgi:hypothetical protein
MTYNDYYNNNYDPYGGWDLKDFSFTDFFFSDMTVAKMIMLVIAGFVFVLTMMSIGINIWDLVVNIYRYSKMGWFQFAYPNYKEKIIKLKFEIYIVGIPSGEIFYIDRDDLKRLKRKSLVNWHNGIGYYTFDDENVEKIKKEISPLIFIRHENGNRVIFDCT